MDLFFLGVFRIAPRTLGLYAAAVKIANLVTAVPFAIANLFAVWVGRRTPGTGEREERAVLLRVTIRLMLGTLLSGAILRLLAPLFIRLLSHGRWEAGEVARMLAWLDWLLAGGVLFSGGLLTTAWLGLRSPVKGLFLEVHLVWTGAAAVLCGVAAAAGGAPFAARASVLVGGLYALLVWLRYRRSVPPRSRGAAS
jgi:Na+-driven multidrug efflux pump